MSWIDHALERSARRAARQISRRSFLARLGAALVGGASLPLLPVSRAHAQDAAPSDARVPAPNEAALSGPVADPASCEYWRHCAIDGFLCSCCGGSQTKCPPGTQMAPVTWIGTCRNPADGKDYVISYNDCCGKDFCGRCICNRNEGDKPAYVTPRANDINWCMAAESTVYNCSTAIVIGLATSE
jgi:methylamine dehydrogenase light chain